MTFTATGTLEIDEIILADSGITSVESEFGDIGPLDVGSGGGITSVTGANNSSGLAGTEVTDTLNEQTEIQREILDEIAGPGGGILSTGGVELDAADVLSVSGALALRAGTVLAMSGVLGVGATSVLALTGTIDMNVKDFVTTSGVLTIGIGSAAVVTGALSLSAPAVLAMSGILGLSATGVLAMTGVLEFKVSDIMAVTGVVTVGLATALAVTGTLSVPATAAIAVTGGITLVASEIIDVVEGNGERPERGDRADQARRQTSGESEDTSITSGNGRASQARRQAGREDTESESRSMPTTSTGQISARERRLFADPSAVSSRSLTDVIGDARRQFAGGRRNPVQMPEDSGDQARSSGTSETTV